MIVRCQFWINSSPYSLVIKYKILRNKCEFFNSHKKYMIVCIAAYDVIFIFLTHYKTSVTASLWLDCKVPRCPIWPVLYTRACSDSDGSCTIYPRVIFPAHCGLWAVFVVPWDWQSGGGGTGLVPSTSTTSHQTRPAPLLCCSSGYLTQSLIFTVRAPQ